MSGAVSSLSRPKPRRILWALAYRAYLAVRRFLPAGWLLDRLLNAAWAVNRLAWEQAWQAMSRGDADKLLRTQTEAFLHEAIEATDRVIDIGGGDGAFTRIALRRAAAGSVLYVDHEPGNVELARAAIPPQDNLEIVQGDALAELERREAFDVALMLHLLEHLDDPVGFLWALRAKCRRVVIEVPDFDAQPLNRLRAARGLPFYSDDDHKSEFTAESLERVLVEAGWDATVRAEGGMLFAVAVSEQRAALETR